MMSKRSRIRLCGQQLVETLKLVCRQVEASRGKREARPQFYMQVGIALFHGNRGKE